MDWNKIGAIANIGCFVVGCLALLQKSSEPSGGFTMQPMKWIFAGCLVVAGVLHFAAARIQTNKQGKRSSPQDLLLKVIWEMIHAHIRRYREISAANPAESKYPLDPKSWPQWGLPWQHVHAWVFAEWVAFERTRKIMSDAFSDINWPADQEIFRASANTTMTSLLAALEDVDYFLRSKVKVLGT